MVATGASSIWATGRMSAVPPRAVALVQSRRAKLQALYEAHHEPVWRLLRRMGLDAARADDATHQVFLVALERLDDIREGSERSFLCGSAVRIARKEFSRNREDLVEELPEVEAGSRPDDQLEDSRRRALLDSLLKRLTPDLREALVLHDFEGYTQVEMAQMLDIPSGTAASRLRRAREQFNTLLEEHLGRSKP